MRNILFMIVLLVASTANAGWDEAAQARYNEQAKVFLREAQAKMESATEVSVYLLGSRDDAKPPNTRSRTFPIRPYKKEDPIADEVVLKDGALQLLRKAWAELAEQDYYMQAMCHYPIYGLRYRDAKGCVVFETSVCWTCSNYYIRTTDGYTWAAFPKRYLAESQFRKQLNELFKKPTK